MRTALALWVGQQPRGARERLARKTGLSRETIDRAKRGLAVHLHTAQLISRATRGEVKVSEILQVKVGRKRHRDVEVDDDDPRAAVA